MMNFMEFFTKSRFLVSEILSFRMDNEHSPVHLYWENTKNICLISQIGEIQLLVNVGPKQTVF